MGLLGLVSSTSKFTNSQQAARARGRNAESFYPYVLEFCVVPRSRNPLPKIGHLHAGHIGSLELDRLPNKVGDGSRVEA